MKSLNLKTTIKVGKRKVRLDDMDHPATAKLIALANLHAERLNNMYTMGKVRKELYDAMK